MKKLLLLLLTLTLVSCWEKADKVTVATVNGVTNVFENCKIDYNLQGENVQSGIYVKDAHLREFYFRPGTIQWFQVEFKPAK